MTSRRMLIPLTVAWLACAGLCEHALAQEQEEETEGADVRIDPATGRDRAHWPPSPMFEYRHMRLAIDIADMQEPKFSGIETLSVGALGSARDGVRLDAGPGIAVKRVLRDGRDAPFRHEDRDLFIELKPPLEAARDADIVIEYDCDFSKNRGNGLTWSRGKEDATGRTDANPQIHSQGEAEQNHLWFPCHDFPNVKLTTELLVTVEDGYEVCSNGRLVERRADEPARGRVTWHWLQDKPHPNYLVTLVIGKFAVVDIGGPDTARAGLPMHVYTPEGTEDRVRRTFERTPDMVAYFEAKFDEPYPWAKYDQLICRDFIWGGMENTSATTLTLGAARGRGGQDDLISHELAHQWFGDLVTCKGWAHVWLNEGWASICEALWSEQRANESALERAPSEGDGAKPSEPAGDAPPVDLIKSGEGGADLGPTAPSRAVHAIGVAPATEAGRRAYQRKMLGFMRSQRGANHAYAPNYPALVSNRYTGAEQAILKSDDVYAKGAMVLHMLRTGLGDDVFTRGTRLYLDRYKFRCAETDDFRRCMEEVSGQSLERFFEQWAYRPGLPRLQIDLDYDDAAKELAVVVDQTQRIDRMNPAYEFRLPLLVKYADGSSEYAYVGVDSRHASATFHVRDKPSDVSVDPNLTVLAASTVRKPLAMWLDELRRGPTLFSRVGAAEALARDGAASPLVSSVLALAALDPSEDQVVREAAANAANLRTVRSVAVAASAGARELTWRLLARWSGVRTHLAASN